LDTTRASEPIVTRTETIRREWEQIFAIPGFRNVSRTTRVEVSRGGDRGYTQGTYSAEFALAEGSSAMERSKWVSVWKKRADDTGRWRSKFATPMSRRQITGRQAPQQEREK
jgi:ketosteroid isomerase-like protein